MKSGEQKSVFFECSALRSFSTKLKSSELSGEKKKKVVYRISLSEVAQNYGDDAYSH